MKTMLTTFLLAAGMALAQTSGTSSTSTASDNSSSNTTRGCLTGTSGSYSIADQSGTSHKLSGNTQDLSSHVNQIVEITGATDPNGNISVTSVKMIADTCPSSTSSTSAAPSTSASTGA